MDFRVIQGLTPEVRQLRLQVSENTVQNAKLQVAIDKYFKALAIFQPYQRARQIMRDVGVMPKGYFKQLTDSDTDGARTVLMNKRTILVTELRASGIGVEEAINFIKGYGNKKYKPIEITNDEVNRIRDEFGFAKFT